jgi:1-pyrroline-4-hydroxy-2-carboxylate deaminase
MKMKWAGVIPAMTTAFKPDYNVDHAIVAKHAAWMIENGCSGIVALGSLGESATLKFDEKVAVLKTLVNTLGSKNPVVAGIASLSTMEGVELAKAAEGVGCSGLMVLPPYVYSSDWREMKAHVQPIMRATKLSCMLYNNPVSYKTDFLPEQRGRRRKCEPGGGKGIERGRAPRHGNKSDLWRSVEIVCRRG